MHGCRIGMQRDERTQQSADQRLSPPSAAALVLFGVTASPSGSIDVGILEMPVKYQSCHSTIQPLPPLVTTG